MTIGERIKQRRLELGLTQTELAHRMGITSKTTICKVETTNFNPTTDRVREFAKALECTPAYLMGWEENKKEIDIEELSIIVSGLKNVPNAKEYIKRALAYYSAFQNADPRIQAAVESLLKDVPPES